MERTLHDMAIRSNRDDALALLNRALDRNDERGLAEWARSFGASAIREIDSFQAQSNLDSIPDDELSVREDELSVREYALEAARSEAVDILQEDLEPSIAVERVLTLLLKVGE